MKLPDRKKRLALLTDGLYYLIGSALYACAVNMFSAPNQIAPGGVTGLATVIWSLTGAPIGMVSLLFNVPLLFLAFRFLGWEFAVRTFFGTTLSAVLTDVSAPFLPPFTGDRILVAVFGGLLIGAGLGFIFRRGGTTGGSEIVARLLEKKLPHWPIGQLLFLIDAVVIALSALVYRQAESALYAVIMVFVSGKVIDLMIDGSRRGRVAMIISEQQTALTVAITETLHRGVTCLSATGGYSGKSRPALLCAVSRSEAYALRRLVMDTDSHAFMMFLSAEEIIGEGFEKGGERHG